MNPTDPEELLEVFDAAGRPTGVAKTRAAIHRDGDWHLAFFCWIFRDGKDGVEVILQKRAQTKDVWPGRYDASAAGHVRFGETAAQASREIEEELGLQVDPSQLVPVMRHRQEHVHGLAVDRLTDLVDREVHDVHVLHCALPLEDYRPGPEVSGLCAVPIDALLELTQGTRESIATTLVTFDDVGGAHHEPLRLDRQQLVSYDAGYLEEIARHTHAHRGSVGQRD